MKPPKDGTGRKRCRDALVVVAAVIIGLPVAFLAARRFSPEPVPAPLPPAPAIPDITIRPNVPTEWRQTDADSAHSRYVASDIPPPLKVAWRVKVETGVAPVAASRDDIYVLGDSMLAAIDARTGAVRWSCQSPGNDGGSQYWYGGQVLATDHRVFCTGTDSRELFILNKDDGAVVRRIDLPVGGDIGSGELSGYGRNQCLIARVSGEHGHSTTHLASVDEDGNVTTGVGLWQVFDSATNTDEFEGVGLGMVGTNSRTIYVQGRHTLLTLDGIKPPYRGARFESADSMATDSTALYVGGGPVVSRLTPKLKEVWSVRMPAAAPGPGTLLLSARRLLFFDGAHCLYSVDKATGRVLWRTLPAGDGGRPILAGDRIYMAVASHGGLPDTLLCLDAATGRTLWSGKIARRIKGLIAHRGALYVLDESAWDKTLSGEARGTYTLMRLDPVSISTGGR